MSLLTECFNDVMGELIENSQFREDDDMMPQLNNRPSLQSRYKYMCCAEIVRDRMEKMYANTYYEDEKNFSEYY